KENSSGVRPPKHAPRHLCCGVCADVKTTTRGCRPWGLRSSFAGTNQIKFTGLVFFNHLSAGPWEVRAPRSKNKCSRCGSSVGMAPCPTSRCDFFRSFAAGWIPKLVTLGGNNEHHQQPATFTFALQGHIKRNTP